MDRVPLCLAQHSPCVNRADRSSFDVNTIGWDPLPQGLKALKIQTVCCLVDTQKAAGIKTRTNTFWSVPDSIEQRLARGSSKKTEDSQRSHSNENEISGH